MRVHPLPTTPAVAARRELLLALHLAADSNAARATIRAWVDNLTGEWGALRDRLAATSPDRIDDAIVWQVCRIAGPTLWRSTDVDNADADRLMDARAAIVLGDLHRVAHETGLTLAETTAWADSTEPSPAAWLLRQAGLDGRTEYVQVARWAVRMAGSARRRAALTRSRTIGDIDGTALERLDELRPCDLCESVVGTLEAASRRQVRELWDGPDELDTPRPVDKRLPPGCRRLTRFLELHQEGAEMRHCIGTDTSYAEGVQARRHDVVAIDLDGDRATALVARGRVLACHARSNAAPSARAAAAAEQCAGVLA